MSGWIGNDLEDLALFAQVVEHRSFTAASRLTGVPQSTISRRVSGLESRIGAQLLDRTTRRIRLTEVGRRTFDHVRLMMAEAGAARDAVEVLNIAPRGHLRVAAPVLLAHSALPSIVSAYMHKYPDVSVAMEWTTRRLDPVEDDVDVVIGPDVSAQTQAWVDMLFASRLGVYVSASFKGRKPEEPEDLSGQTLFGVTRGLPSQLLAFERDGKTVSVPVSLQLKTNDIGIVIEAADLCGGLALVPDFAAPASWILTCSGWNLPLSEVAALTTRHGRKLPRVAAFVDALRAGLQSNHAAGINPETGLGVR